MKKLLILLVCLLPLFAQAESLPALESEVPLQFAYAPTQLEEVVLLPGDIPLLYYTNGEAARTRDCLAAVAPNGDVLWQLILDPRQATGNERHLLMVNQTDVTLQQYNLPQGTCSSALVGFDGQLIFSSVSEASERPACYNQGDFQVLCWFGDYTQMQTPTVITHLPSGQRTETALPGQGSFHAFGDWLMYITWDEPGGRYWLFDQQGQTLVDNAPAPFGCDRPIVGFSAQDENGLNLFVWCNSPGQNGCALVWANNPDQDGRIYTVFPVDAQGSILPAFTGFGLGRIECEDFLTDYAKSLSQPVALGDGFMLLALHPWQWGQPGTTDLYYLDRAGKLTLLDTFTQEDEVFLLPGLDGDHCRLMCRSKGGDQLLLRTYVAN